MTMLESSRLAANRWQRFGHDRLYVSAVQGEGELPSTEIGWWDLLTDEAHPKASEYSDMLAEAVADWRREHGVRKADPTPDTVPEPTPSPEPAAAAALPWRDLAANPPGERARERAVAKRRDAPVRSRLARVLGVHTDERAWRIGADGEQLVAAQLERLARKDPRWRFLHAIPVGTRGADIDHLAIGPGGVFTINAKHHPNAEIWVGGNTVMVDGNRMPYVRHARFEAARAAVLLSNAGGFPVHVHGLVVTVNAKDVVVRNQPDGVSVTWRNNLVKMLRGYGEILSDDAIEAIYEVARRSTTWGA